MMLRSQGSWCSGRAGGLLVNCSISATESINRGTHTGAAIPRPSGEEGEEVTGRRAGVEGGVGGKWMKLVGDNDSA